jgi:hypothetical protein
VNGRGDYENVKHFFKNNKKKFRKLWIIES